MNCGFRDALVAAAIFLSSTVANAQHAHSQLCVASHSGAIGGVTLLGALGLPTKGCATGVLQNSVQQITEHNGDPNTPKRKYTFDRIGNIIRYDNYESRESEIYTYDDGQLVGILNRDESGRQTNTTISYESREYPVKITMRYSEGPDINLRIDYRSREVGDPTAIVYSDLNIYAVLALTENGTVRASWFRRNPFLTAMEVSRGGLLAVQHWGAFDYVINTSTDSKNSLIVNTYGGGKIVAADTFDSGDYKVLARENEYISCQYEYKVDKAGNWTERIPACNEKKMDPWANSYIWPATKRAIKYWGK